MALAVSVLKMRDLLLRAKVVDEVQMRAALARLERYGGRLPKVLTDMGLIDEEQVTKVIAEALHLPLQALGAVRRDPDALSRLDVRLCEENGIFPVSLNLKTHTLVLAMAEPTALDVVDLVAARVNARVQTVVASESQIAAAIGKYYYGRAPSAVASPTSRAGRSPLNSPRSPRASTAQLPQPPRTRATTCSAAGPAPTRSSTRCSATRPLLTSPRQTWHV